MSDCFIGYRLRQRLNEMEERLAVREEGPPVQAKKKFVSNATNSLTCVDTTPKFTSVTADVAGLQPGPDGTKGDLK